MITEKLKTEISEFSRWYTKNKQLAHYECASKLFDKDKAQKIHNELQEVIDSYPLPNDIYT